MATVFNAGKAIGPSFPSELQAAGLMGLACAWGSDGLFEFGPALTAAQITAIKVVITAHNPLDPAPFTPSFFTALKSVLGLTVAQMNQMLMKYPLFAPAVQGQDWPTVQALIIQAHVALDIADLQYQAVKSAVAQAGLSGQIVLP